VSKAPSTALTVSEKIADLRSINDIDAMLKEGTSSNDVAKFIQETLRELRSINTKTLAKALKERAAGLIQQEQDVSGLEIQAAEGRDNGRNRLPSTLTRNLYKRLKRNMDLEIELEGLYLAQRDRIEWLMELENDAVQPLEGLFREFGEARETLVHLAKVRSLVTARQGAGSSLNVSEYTRETAEVLGNPESRRRVVTLIERVRKLEMHADMSGALDASE